MARHSAQADQTEVFVGGCTVGVSVLVEDGPDRGRTATLTFVTGPTDPQLGVDERIRMGSKEPGRRRYSLSPTSSEVSRCWR